MHVLTEAELLKREASFCTLRPLNILMCTWNLDNAKPDVLTGPENTSFFVTHLQSMESPDIIVFGFQEVINLEDHKLAASALLLFPLDSGSISFTHIHSARRIGPLGRKQKTSGRTYIRKGFQTLSIVARPARSRNPTRDSARGVHSPTHRKPCRALHLRLRTQGTCLIP